VSHGTVVGSLGHSSIRGGRAEGNEKGENNQNDEGLHCFFKRGEGQGSFLLCTRLQKKTKKKKKSDEANVTLLYQIRNPFSPRDLHVARDATPDWEKLFDGLIWKVISFHVSVFRPNMCQSKEEKLTVDNNIQIH